MKRRLSIFLAAALALFVCLAGNAMAKSVYATTHSSNSFQAFNINPPDGDLTSQGTYTLSYAYTPAGVAVHNPTGYLFISEESSDIEIVDNNLNSVGRLAYTQYAGLAVDDDANILYAIRRNSTTLDAFDITFASPYLTRRTTGDWPRTLSGMASSGMGIVLDYRSTPKILWVSDGYNDRIRAYDTTTWSQVDSITTPSGARAVGIGMDTVSRIIYYGSWSYGAWGPGNGTSNCYSVDISGSPPYTVVAHNVGGQVADISVDDDTGLVYLTQQFSSTGGVRVYDPTTTPWTQVDSATMNRSMAGLVVAGVSFMPDLAVEKTDDVDDDDCAGVGGSITYTISYENTGDTDLSNVTIVDALPVEVTVAAGTPGYNDVGHTVTWTILALAEGASGTVSVAGTINATATPGSTIINYATIDSDETNPTTVQENTDICLNQPPVAVISAVADADIPLPVTMKVTPQTLNLSRLGKWVKAHLCADFEVAQEMEVTLDGSGSYDPDEGDIITFSWTLTGPDGEVELDDPTAEETSVILPSGSYDVTLVVNDGTVDSEEATDSFTLTDETIADLAAGTYTLNDVGDSEVKGGDDDCIVISFDDDEIAATVEVGPDVEMVLEGTASGVDYIDVIQGGKDGSKGKSGPKFK